MGRRGHSDMGRALGSSLMALGKYLSILFQEEILSLKKKKKYTNVSNTGEYAILFTATLWLTGRNFLLIFLMQL